MAREIESNLILINAPAGSGKTTTIEKNIVNILSSIPKSKVLCITYTNRAAEELLSRINNSNVQIQTIHSFINEFIKIYFSHEEILKIYFEIYGDKIKSDIENKEEDSGIKRRNDKYKQRYMVEDEEFCFELIEKSIVKINYNELSFNSLYYGGLGHDDLLSFTNTVINTFPVLQKRIIDKFDYIYIDEYQDTSANILDIFYTSVKGTETKLYLLGDKMQQIYKNYDGSFEEELLEFDTSNKLNINYRSSEKIVDVLNNIYNDENFIQDPNKKAVVNSDCKKPTVIITNNVEEILNNEKLISQDTLKLYVFNSSRFKAINAEALYTAVKRMKSYSNMSKYSAVDVLTNKSNDNPDDLVRCLKIINDTIEMFCKQEYGKVIQSFKNNKIFNPSKIQINIHDDKVTFSTAMKELCNEYYKKDNTIKSLLEMMIDKNILIKDKFIIIFENQEYEDLLKVDLNDFKNLELYLKQPTVSTQHGVKGEGYDSVCFIAEDSSNPSVKMSSFLKLISKESINLTDFQRFYYDYTINLQDIEDKLKCKFSKLKAPEFKIHEQEFTGFLRKMQVEMDGNIYFEFIFDELFNKYFGKPNKTNIEPCLKSTNIFGMLTAYRLFYVGCSRAKKELTVLIDENKIIEFKDEFITKMELIGFNVVQI